MQTRRAVLTLGELLEEKALGLALRAGPAGAAERPVRGAAVVEVESPGGARVVFVGVSLVTAPAGNGLAAARR